MNVSKKGSSTTRESSQNLKTEACFDDQHDRPTNSECTISAWNNKLEKICAAKQIPAKEMSIKDVIKAMVNEKREEKRVVATRQMKKQHDDKKTALSEACVGAIVPLTEPVYQPAPAEHMPPPPIFSLAENKSTKLARSSKPSNAGLSLDPETQKIMMQIEFEIRDQMLNNVIDAVVKKNCVKKRIVVSATGQTKEQHDVRKSSRSEACAEAIGPLTESVHRPAPSERLPPSSMPTLDPKVQKPVSVIKTQNESVKQIQTNDDVIDAMVEKEIVMSETRRMQKELIDRKIARREAGAKALQMLTEPVDRRVPHLPPSNYIPQAHYKPTNFARLSKPSDAKPTLDPEELKPVSAIKTQNEFIRRVEPKIVVHRGLRQIPYSRGQQNAINQRMVNAEEIVAAHNKTKFEEQLGSKQRSDVASSSNVMRMESDRFNLSENVNSIQKMIRKPSMFMECAHQITTAKQTARESNVSLSTQQRWPTSRPPPTPPTLKRSQLKPVPQHFAKRRCIIRKLSNSRATCETVFKDNSSENEKKVSIQNEQLETRENDAIVEQEERLERREEISALSKPTQYYHTAKHFHKQSPQEPKPGWGATKGLFDYKKRETKLSICTTLKLPSFDDDRLSTTNPKLATRLAQLYGYPNPVLKRARKAKMEKMNSTYSSQYGEITYQTLLEAKVRIEAAKKASNGITASDNDLTSSSAENDKMLVKDEIDYGYTDFVSDDRAGLLRFPKPVERHAQKQIITYTKKAVAANVKTEESTVKLEPIDDYEPIVTVLREEKKPKIN